MKDFEFIEVEDQIDLKKDISNEEMTLDEKGFSLIESENTSDKYYYRMEKNNSEEKNNSDEDKEPKKLNLNCIEIKDDNTPIVQEVIFDSKVDSWKIKYIKDGKADYDIIYNDRSKRRLDFAIQDGLKDKTYNNILKKTSIGLLSSLSYFDKKYKTNYTDEYLKDTSNYKIIYDLYNINRSNLTLKGKISLYYEAMNQQKYRNALIKKPRNHFILQSLLSIGLIIGLVNIFPTKTKNDKLDDTLYTKTKFNQEKSIENEEKNTTNYTKDIEVSEDNTKVIIQNQDNKTETKLKMNDELLLDNVELSNTALSKERAVNTNKLNCDSYKVSAIAVAYYNQILDVKTIKNTSNDNIEDMVEKYKDEFGEDINIYVNFDGYHNNNMVYHNVGWSDLKNINSLNEEQQTSLENIKNNLADNDVQSFQKVKKI